MWIVFNKSGAIVKDFQEYGAPARQGTAGGFYIFVYTEGLQIKKNYIASIIFERPDKLTTSAYTMDYVARFPFSKNELDDPNINIDPMMDGQTYPGFIFYVNNAGLFSASGTYRATVRIYDGRKQLTQGVITFNAQESAYLDDAEINFTQEQYDSIMDKLSEYGADIGDLQTGLSEEREIRANADANLQGQIDAHTREISALDAEMDTKQDVLTFDTTPTENSTNPVTSGGIYTYVNSAIDAHQHDVTVLDAKIDQEILDRQAADTTLQGNIDAEERRAKAAESDLGTAIETEGSQRVSNDATLQRAIDDEVTRATTKEGQLETAIGNETTRASTKEGQLETAIGNEVTARQQADQALDARITTLEGKNVLVASDIADNLTTNDSSKVLSAKQGKVLKDALDSEESTRQTNDNTLQTNIDNEATARSSADSALSTRINNLDLSQVGAAGSYIKLVSQTDGLVSATAEAFDTEITANPSNTNASTTKAVKDYVDANGGKIDSISVNNVAQTIDVNKNVNIDLSNYVTLSNAQTISGAKTFTNTVTVENLYSGDYGGITITGGDDGILLDAHNAQSAHTAGVEVNAAAFAPYSNNATDLGASSQQFKNLYLKGKIVSNSAELTLPSSTGTLALQSEIPSLTNYVTLDGTQTITGAKNFTGTVPVSPSNAGVQLGIDNSLVPNANISIVSSGSAAYIDMGVPDSDYDFRVIKWNDPSGEGTNAQLVYGNNGGTITIPKETGTMALTSDISNALGSYYTSSQVDTLLNAKQDNLTFDSAPTANSTNPVTSEGIKTYVDTNGGKIDTISIGGVQQTIDANKNVDLPAYPTKSSLGLGNVDNTSDLNKPVSTATQTALDGKLNKVTGTTTRDQAYVKKSDGTQNMMDLGSGLVSNCIVTRDGTQIAVPETPTANGYATSKKYVDDSISTVSTAVSTVDDKLNVNVHIEGNSDEITYSGDTVTKTSPYKNLKTGTTGTRSEVIHLANSTTAGMMSPADYNQIRDNTSRIQALEGRAARIQYTTSTTPTATQIKLFVDDFLLDHGYEPGIAAESTDTWSANTWYEYNSSTHEWTLTTSEPADWSTNYADYHRFGVTAYNAVSVVVAGTNHVWNYYANDGVYVDDGLDTVTQFSNSIPGIILGSSSDGQVFAENDGTGSVYGWSDLKNRVSNVETGLSNHENNTNNPHGVTKSQVGLGNVDNTSDLDKPISTATQTALNAKANDNAVVHLADSETVTGTKTFSSQIQLSNSNHYIRKNSSGNTVEIGANGTTVFTIGASSTAVNSILRANSDNSKDLGNSTTRWKDLYLSGSLKDGTNSFDLPSSSGTLALTGDIKEYGLDDTASSGVAVLDASGLSYTSASASGSDTFVKTISGGSGSFDKTQKYLHPTTTSVVTSVTVGGTASAVTGISAGHLYGTRDTTSVSTRRTLKLNYASASASGTATVATGVTVGNTVDAITGLSASTTETTGDILYMENATHTHTGASVATSGSAVTAITAGSLTKTDKYLTLEEE